MNIKSKILLSFIVMTFFVTVPGTYFLFKKREAEHMDAFIQQQRTVAGIIAQTAVNVLMMNGGDIRSSSVDAGELISFLNPYFSKGLVYSDIIVLSGDKKNYGRVLSSIEEGKTPEWAHRVDDIVDKEYIGKLINLPHGYTEIKKTRSRDGYYVFAAPGLIPGCPPFCLARMVFSKKIIYEPMVEERDVIFIASVIFMGIFVLFGYIFSDLVSRRIHSVIEGVKKIEAGNLTSKVEVKSRDELGLLSEAFNRMAFNLDLKITELEETNRELHRMDAFKDEFLANTSHELRTPISGIVGLAESLLDGAAGDVNETMKRNLFMIASSGRRLSNLVNDILDFSRLKNKEIELNRTAVDIRSVLNLVIAIMKSLADKKSIRLRNMVHPDSPLVSGDEDRIQQVLVNLVGNAIKFTDRGEVVFSSETETDAGRKFLIVRVQDTGIGISKDKIGRIFESFEQGDGSISRKYGGTGLGLAISRKLIDLHGGRIWAESVEGQGTTVSFKLPVCTEELNEGKPCFSAGDEYSAIARKELENYDKIGIPEKILQLSREKSIPSRILIVDDEPINLQVLINHLAMAGYEVMTAVNGFEALDIIDQEGIPDLILLDIMMPQMSGLEVCQTLRKTYSQHELPVVMLTARKRSQDIIAGIEAGANDYISKPFDKQELLARVANLLTLKTAVSEHRQLSLIREEMITARNIQQSILPTELPSFSWLDIQAGYKPMQAVGGDFYDFHYFDDNRIGVLIADVSGHGIPAAIICSMLKIVFEVSRTYAEEPAELMNYLNTNLCNYVHGQFITVSYAYVDYDQRKITVSNAGHWPLLLWRKKERSLEELSRPGRVIGFFPEAVYSEYETKFEDGDRLILYTDGILESRNREGILYGEKNFHDTVDSCVNLRASDIIDVVLDSVSEWSGNTGNDSFEDDVTLIVMDFISGEQ